MTTKNVYSKWKKNERIENDSLQMQICECILFIDECTSFRWTRASRRLNERLHQYLVAYFPSKRSRYQNKTKRFDCIAFILYRAEDVEDQRYTQCALCQHIQFGKLYTFSIGWDCETLQMLLCCVHTVHGWIWFGWRVWNVCDRGKICYIHTLRSIPFDSLEFYHRARAGSEYRIKCVLYCVENGERQAITHG